MNKEFGEVQKCAGCGEARVESNPRYCATCRKAYARYMQEGPDIGQEIYRESKMKERDLFSEKLKEGFRILHKI